MWGAPNDPQIYGALEIDATNLKAFLDACRERGHKVTPTHLVGRAVAVTLREVPEMNVRIVGENIIPRSSVDVFFQTAVEGGRDLSGVKVTNADKKSAVEVAQELTERSRAAKEGRDAEFAKSKSTMNALPLPLLRLALRGAAWLTGDRDTSIRALGLASSPFGSAAVTSIGMFGLPIGFAPLSWMYKIPLLVLVGTIEDRPVVVDGRVEVRPILPVTATIDHRFVDGWHIARAMRTFRAYLDSPANYESQT